jgi:uncharacterized SAM-binding protein YcdF (DUF218 family)
MSRSSWLRGFARGLQCVLVSIGSIVLVVTFTPLVSWWGTLLAGSWTDPKGDVLIVLGGSSSSGGVMGYSSYLRSEYASWAYRDGGFHQIILSGGGSPIPIAAAMKDFLQCHGVPADVMQLESRSSSTRENALYTKVLLAGASSGSLVLLTSDFHMFRAKRAFDKVGIHVLPRPIPDVRKRGTSFVARWGAFIDLLEESGKIMYYWARGWI